MDMADFTPPTFKQPFNPESQDHPKYSLWRWYAGYNTPYSVLITDGVATPYPGTVSPTIADTANADAGSGEGGQAWFRGGITYSVTSAEETILVAAGYTI